MLNKQVYKRHPAGPARRRDVQGGEARHVPGRRGGRPTPPEQAPSEVDVAALHGAVQGRVALLVTRIPVRSIPQQEPGDGGVAASAGHM
jgi:hypothetical protein